MARRGKSQARRSGGSGGVPGWVWLAAGVLLGLALSVFVLVRQGGLDAERLLPRPNPAAEAPKASEEPVAQRRDPAPKKPRYDFYTILPEKEVVVPEAEITAPTTQPARSNERYLLQVGAFRDARDADALKARLALLGLVARVQADTIEGIQWHRVRLGPYETLPELDGVRRQLAQNDIEALAIKVPKE